MRDQKAENKNLYFIEVLSKNNIAHDGVETERRRYSMGLVHIYCGDGKGKTTSAVGLAVRCAGSGSRVLFYQFMKPETSSERKVLKQIPEVTVLSGYTISKFSFAMTDEEKAEAAVGYQKQFADIVQLLEKGEYQMVILDEIMSCINCGFLPLEAVLDWLKNRPDGLEVVMTGRDPAPCLVECADYVSEVQKQKHPFDHGVRARKGIEF